jgi:predicted O-methyltransferase YrrM
MSILKPEQLDYLNNFIEEENSLLQEMRVYADENNFPILSLHSSIFLKQIIRIAKPLNVLEIGTAIAYSAINIALNLPPNGMIDTIENSAENIGKAKIFIEKAGLSKKINLIQGDALDVIPELEKKYDLIFLDADKHIYIEAFEKSISVLNDEGIMFVDNLLWQGYAAGNNVPEKYINSTQNIREFNEYFMNLNNFISTIIPVGDGIGLAVKKKEANDGRLF